MARAQTATTFAIAIGAFLGALAAMLERKSSPPPEVSPSAAATPTAVVTAPAPVVPPTAPDSAAPSADASTEQGWEIAAPVMDAESASLACARLDIVACLSAADALRKAGNTEQAELHERLAAQRFAARCQQRDPEACGRLADLYAHGRGVAQSDAQHEALLERTRQICSSRPKPGCPD